MTGSDGVRALEGDSLLSSLYKGLYPDDLTRTTWREVSH